MSYDDDDEDRKQEYECQNAGCIGDRTFKAAPEEWFKENDLTPPKNCPTCRAWNDKQKEIGPVVATCQFCKYIWPIEATYRIIYHKNVGNWDQYWSEQKDFQICRRCEEMPFQRRKLRERLAESKLRNRTPEDNRQRVQVEQKDWRELLFTIVNELGLEATPERIDVPDAMSFYRDVKTSECKVSDHGENQLTHILKDDHKWSGKLGSEDPYTVLTLARSIAISTEGHVLQFKDRFSKLIVKYDADQEVAVVIRESDRSPTGFLTHTTFPKTIKQAHKKVKYGKWK